MKKVKKEKMARGRPRKLTNDVATFTIRADRSLLKKFAAFCDREAVTMSDCMRAFFTECVKK